MISIGNPTVQLNLNFTYESQYTYVSAHLQCLQLKMVWHKALHIIEHNTKSLLKGRGPIQNIINKVGMVLDIVYSCDIMF